LIGAGGWDEALTGSGRDPSKNQSKNYSIFQELPPINFQELQGYL